MRQIEGGSLEDKARRLVSEARAMIADRDNDIVKLRRQLSECQEKLKEVRRRSSQKADGVLRERCEGCIYRIEIERKLREGKRG